MKLLKLIKEEILPLNSRQNLILLVIISSIFQFTLFFAPVLANEAVNQAKAQGSQGEDFIVSNSPLIKEGAFEYPTTQRFSQPESLTPNTAATELISKATTTETEILESPNEPDAEKKPELKVVRTSTHVITAYNSEVGQTDSTPCITANGFNVCEHGVEDTIAANFLKFGTKVQIPDLFGDRIFIVRDRMNKKHPSRVDIWMLDRTDALKFGKRTAKIVVVE